MYHIINKTRNTLVQHKERELPYSLTEEFLKGNNIIVTDLFTHTLKVPIGTAVDEDGSTIILWEDFHAPFLFNIKERV